VSSCPESEPHVTTTFDVVIATDCRLPGGTAASTAEEITAQARAGIRTGLVHIDSPLVSRTRPFNPRLRACLESGQAELVMPTTEASAHLLVVRHPKVALTSNAPHVPRIRAKTCIVLINQEPITGRNIHYRADEVNKAIREWAGLEALWAPIGPLARRAFSESEPNQTLLPDDWVNIIDLEAWSKDREPTSSSLIRIGRHSRDHRLKWPSTADEIRNAYPSADDIQVRILGGATHALAVLDAHQPPNWVIHEFGSIDVRDFLHELDVFVYFHHPDLTEAFGRALLEAMAAGVPVITDRHFEPLFAGAAIYATPSEVGSIVRRLASEPEYAGDYREKGHELVRQHFSYERHIKRISQLGVVTENKNIQAPDCTQKELNRQTGGVLFVSPNGAGMGHLTRVMAVGKHLAPNHRVRFFTFSSAANIVLREGFDVDYSPSRAVTGSKSEGWHHALDLRMNEIIREFKPSVVVIDGTEPYRGLLRALARHPEIFVVWLRRGMWKEGVTNAVFREGSDFFDMVIEPGDLAFQRDRGVTARRNDHLRVNPVTYVSRNDILDRRSARREMGIDESVEAVLINLGAGNINEVGSTVRSIIEHLSDERRQLYVVRSPISRSGASTDTATEIDQYPLGRLLRAFDFAISAVGYNSFHELLLAGVPTVFVPNEQTLADDQDARARWAFEQGLGACVDSSNPDDIARALDAATDYGYRSSLRERLSQIGWENGALEIAATISTLILDPAPPEDRGQLRSKALERIEASAIGAPPRCNDPKQHRLRFNFPSMLLRRCTIAMRERLDDRRIRRLAKSLPNAITWRVRRLLGVEGPAARGPVERLLRIPPGLLLGDVDEARLTPVLIVIEETVDNRSIVESVARRQLSERTFAPVFLTQSLECSAFREYGYVWEHLRKRDQDESEAIWAARRQRRLAEIVTAYGPILQVAVSALSDVESNTSLFAQSVRMLDPTE